MNKEENEKPKNRTKPKDKVIQYGLELTKNRLPCLVKEKTYAVDDGRLLSAAMVNQFCRNCLKLDRKAEEKLFLFCLSTSGFPNAVFCSELSSGTSTASLINERGLATRLALSSATSCILAHCHPSGSINPSREDIESAKHISEITRILTVQFLDFLIIGKDMYYSFAENNILP